MISIIMPAFNAENTIKRSIDSVRKQTYKDWELIIVNDGSRDNTKEICEKEAKKNNKIKVINKANEGVSKARNTGMKLAKGKYLCFLDSDDIFENDMLEKLYMCLVKNDVDVVKCNINKEYIFMKEKKYNKDEIINNIIPLLLKEKVKGYVWTLMIKKEKAPLFNEKISIYEDLDFYIKLLSNVESLFFYNENLYLYNHHIDNSLTKKNIMFNINEMIKADAIIKNDLQAGGLIKIDYHDMIDTRVITNINNYLYLLVCKKEKQNIKKVYTEERKLNILKNYNTKYVTFKERIFNYSIINNKKILFFLLCKTKNIFKYIKKNI